MKVSLSLSIPRPFSLNVYSLSLDPFPAIYEASRERERGFFLFKGVVVVAKSREGADGSTPRSRSYGLPKTLSSVGSNSHYKFPLRIDLILKEEGGGGERTTHHHDIVSTISLT